jgi:hypothetical protein
MAIWSSTSSVVPSFTAVHRPRARSMTHIIDDQLV